MKNFMHRLASACLLLLTVSLAACVDDDYDLSKDIDMTMTVGGSYLAIPTSSSERIPLKDLVELKEGTSFDTVKVAGEVWSNSQRGDYYVYSSTETLPEPDWHAPRTLPTRAKLSIPPIENWLEVTGVPDFLINNEANLDLSNPCITLYVDNTLSEPVQPDELLLRSFHSTELIHELAVPLNGISIPANAAHHTIDIVRKGTPSSHTVVEPELSTLLRRIPNLLYSQATIHDVNYTGNLDGNLSEPLQIKMALLVPVSFGKNFEVTYADTLDNWNSDLKDIEVRKLQVTVNSSNEIPLDFELLRVTAIDTEGEALPDVKVEVDRVNRHIRGGIKGTPGAGNLQVTLTAASGGMKTLDGLRYELRGTADELAIGRTMNSNQTLHFTAIKLVVLDGIKIDFNDDEDKW